DGDHLVGRELPARNARFQSGSVLDGLELDLYDFDRHSMLQFARGAHSPRSICWYPGPRSIIAGGAVRRARNAARIDAVATSSTSQASSAASAASTNTTP